MNLKNRLARLRSLGLTPATETKARGAGGSDAKGEAVGRGAPDGTGKVRGPSYKTGKGRGGGDGKARSAERARLAALARLVDWNEVREGVYTRTVVYPAALPGVMDLTPFTTKPATTIREYPYGERMVKTERFVFFDLETTGLSCGAGTVAFLAAVARQERDELSVRQFFLSDYPYEPDFLDEIAACFGEDDIIASYNGASFDMPLLATRLSLNRRPRRTGEHVDLLVSARRLWKRRLGSVALQSLERGILGYERVDDVPGALIPGIYFDWLRNGGHPLLDRVFDHNARDVRSLARILALMDRAFGRPDKDPTIDLERAGRVLFAAGRTEAGLDCIERAAFEQRSPRAAIFLSTYHRARGRGEESLRVLDACDPCAESLVERSKVQERCGGDCAHALDSAREALVLARGTKSERWIAGLSRRVERLERRIDPCKKRNVPLP